MKNSRIYYLITGMCLSLILSCTDFDEMNTNPNSPSSENPASESVLASCMRKAFHEDRFEFWRGVVLHAERFAGHVEGGFAGCWWAGGSAYTYNEGWTSGVWSSYNSSSFTNGFGGNIFANLDILIEYYEDNPEADYANEFLGISHTLRAFQFLKISDLFGDIPYTEHGNIDIPSPKFDSQELLYNDLEEKLKKAVEEYLKEETTMPSMNGYDLVFNGDVRKWQKFANSLRLRMALRRSNVDESTAKTILSSITSYPILGSNEDNVLVERTQSSTDLHNQYYGFFKTWPGTIPDAPYSWDGYSLTWGPGAGAFIPAYEIIEIMKGTELYASEVAQGGSASENINAVAGIEDPRLDKFFMKPKGNLTADHKGMPARAIYALKNDAITTISTDPEEGDVLNYSWMHPDIWYDGGTWNPVSMDYAEICFAMAEAVLRNLVSSTKSDVEWLKEGLQASCERWNATAGTFPDDVAAKYNSATQENKLAIIATERWISAYTVPHQAYSVLRRTGHPLYCYLDRDARIKGIWTNPDGTTEAGKEIEKYAEGSTNYMLPQRMRVPESEIAVNANVPEENKDMKNKVWWAK